MIDNKELKGILQYGDIHILRGHSESYGTGNLEVAGNLTVRKNLIVHGTRTEICVNRLTVDDTDLIIAKRSILGELDQLMKEVTFLRKELDDIKCVKQESKRKGWFDWS